MIPTILYAFDKNPLIAHWNGKLRQVMIDDKIRVILIEGISQLGEVDVVRTILPFYGKCDSKVRIHDTWSDKLDSYKRLAKILGKKENSNSKVTFLKPLNIKSTDALAEMDELGGETFILRPVSGTRSIDAFIINHTKKKPFRFCQFMCIYRNLYEQRSSSNIIQKSPIVEAFRELGVRILSDNTWQEIQTSMGQLKNAHISADRFFLQTFEDFDSEYRIIKAAPNKYFGYKYSDNRGWVEDLQLMPLDTLDKLIGKELADEFIKIFEDEEMPFMCSADIGLKGGSIVVHEFSPEFMTTEYSPYDLNKIADAHIRGVIDLYLKETTPTKPKVDLKYLSDEEYLSRGVIFNEENFDKVLAENHPIVLHLGIVAGAHSGALINKGYVPVKNVPHTREGGTVEVVVYVKK